MLPKSGVKNGITRNNVNIYDSKTLELSYSQDFER